MQIQCWFCPHCYAETVFEHSDDCPNRLSEQQLNNILATVTREMIGDNNER